MFCIVILIIFGSVLCLHSSHSISICADSVRKLKMSVRARYETHVERMLR